MSLMEGVSPEFRNRVEDAVVDKTSPDDGTADSGSSLKERMATYRPSNEDRLEKLYDLYFEARSRGASDESAFALMIAVRFAVNRGIAELDHGIFFRRSREFYAHQAERRSSPHIASPSSEEAPAPYYIMPTEAE